MFSFVRLLVRVPLPGRSVVACLHQKNGVTGRGGWGCKKKNDHKEKGVSGLLMPPLFRCLFSQLSRLPNTNLWLILFPTSYSSSSVACSWTGLPLAGVANPAATAQSMVRGGEGAGGTGGLGGSGRVGGGTGGASHRAGSAAGRRRGPQKRKFCFAAGVVLLLPLLALVVAYWVLLLHHASSTSQERPQRPSPGGDIEDRPETKKKDPTNNNPPLLLARPPGSEGGAIARALEVFRNNPAAAAAAAAVSSEQQRLTNESHATAMGLASTSTTRKASSSSASTSWTHSSSVAVVPTPPVQNYTLPPLETLVTENGTIVGDIQILLHFAIVGFGKCGTTSLLELLRTHSNLQALQSEVWALSQDNPARLLRRLHRKLPENLPRGYKCPGDVLSSRVLDFYRIYWPTTKLFIGIRSPVWHFQSLYNFRVQNFVDFHDIKAPNELLGPCTRAMKMVCTKRGHFGYYLLRLGKHRIGFFENDDNHTQSTTGNANSTGTIRPLAMSSLEKSIANWYPSDPRDPPDVPLPLPNPVFLYDVHQLADGNASRRAQFRQDVATFLGVSPDDFRNSTLTDPLQHHRPGREWDITTQAQKDAKKINICDTQHAIARSELVKQAQASSQWIRTVFLNAPGVHVSSRPYVESLLLEWMNDPCVAQFTSTSAAVTVTVQK